jgi:hypothetical protein
MLAAFDANGSTFSRCNWISSNIGEIGKPILTSLKLDRASSQRNETLAGIERWVSFNELNVHREFDDLMVPGLPCPEA